MKSRKRKPRKPLSEEQKQALRARLDLARLAKQNKAASAAESLTTRRSEADASPALPAPAPLPVIDRERLLAGIDPAVAALISDAELAAIAAEEDERAKQEQKAAALRDLRAALKQRARAEHDLIPLAALRTEEERKRLSEPVTFRVNVPMDGSGDPGRGAAGFRVDGQLFQHGMTYTRSRAVFESLLGMHYRVHLHEVTFRTLDQHKPGNSAVEVLGRSIPQFEVRV